MNNEHTKGTNRFGKIIGIVISLMALLIIFSIAIGRMASCMNTEYFPRKYEKYVEKYAGEYGVPEAVAYAVIKVESDFEQYAVSSSDPPAKGLMQITEETFVWVGGHLLKEDVSVSKIYDPETNIKYGIYLLSYLYGRFENWETAYAAYNAGMSRVYTWLDDPRYSDENGNLKDIPYPETRAYVKKVAEYREKYEKLYYNEK